jgi:Spy/CpxP family protein refolding chaperone
MSLRTKVFAAIFAVFAFAVAGYAQDAKVDTSKKTRPDGWIGDGIRKGMREDFDKIRRGGLFGIELTDAQLEQIRAIRQSAKPDKATIDELRTLAKAKWEGTLTADQQARLDALKGEAKAKAKSIHDQIQAVLTPEQKAQIEQRKQEMRQKRTEMRQKMNEFRQKMREHRKQKDATKTTTTEPTKTN